MTANNSINFRSLIGRRFPEIAAIILLAAIPAYPQGTVSLSNTSYPLTAIEVGNYVTVTITGAAANSDVVSVQNGGAPYTWPTQTNIFGNWSVTAQETSGTAGNYYQTWSVANVDLTPVNPTTAYFGTYAPALPSFTVYNTGTPANPTAQVGNVNACGGPTNITPAWIWTPVGFVTSTASYNTSANAAATAWNNAQSKISLYENSTVDDIEVVDTTSLPTSYYGATGLVTQACNTGCYNQVDTCNGACGGSTALFFTETGMNDSTISGAASEWGGGATTIATALVTHEIGHSLSLADLGSAHGGCSEARSIMDFGLTFLCGISAPSSSDVSVVNSVYPSAPGYCSAGDNYCDGVSC